MHLETEQDQTDLRMLEFMYDSGDDRAAAIPIRDLLTHYGTENEGREWLRSAEGRLLIRTDKRNYPSFALTDKGRRVVQEARQRRGNPGHRRRALQSRVLAYVDSQCPTVGAPMALPSQFPESEYAVLDGVHFTEDEANDAVDFLVDRGLLKSSLKAWGGVHVRVGITHEGRECADHGYDVAAYLAAQRQGIPTIQVNGDVQALSAALGPNSTATATVTTISIDAAVLLAEAVEQALPHLGLDADALQAVADIKQRHDPGKVKRGLQWIAGLANSTSAGALGTVLGTVALNLLGVSPGT